MNIKIIPKNLLVNLYVEKKKSMPEITKLLNFSYTCVRNNLLRYNIEIRSMEEATLGKNIGNKRPDLARFNRLRNYEGKNSPNYIDGRCLKKYYCKDCGKEISITSALYGEGYCWVCAHVGVRNFNYVDGKSSERNNYPSEFNNKLKEQIRKRDNYTCQLCGMIEEEHLILYGVNLSIHHIDYDKENNEEDNLVSTCNQCHGRTNFNRNYWIKYFEEGIENGKYLS